MTRRSQRRALTLILAACTAVAGLPSAAHADPRPAAIDSWQRTTSVRLPVDGSLSDVLALPSGEVWAVGQQQIWDVWKNRGTIRHWNGERWSEIGIRDSTGAGNLRSVSAESGEVWTVGDGHDGLPYIAHGGVGGFDRVIPQGLRSGDWLGGVDAGPQRVISVGSRGKHALVVTREGGTWHVRETGQKGALYAVDGDLAVGDTGTAPLVMKRSGSTWKPVKLPSVPGGYLRDVHVEGGGKRALAVGGVYHGPGEVSPLALAWDGKRWRRLSVRTGKARLYGVTSDGKGRFWVSGYDPERAAEAYLLRCEKLRCSVLRGEPADGRSSVRLQAVTYLPGSKAVWAVGHAVDGQERYTDVVEAFGPRDPDKKS